MNAALPSSAHDAERGIRKEKKRKKQRGCALKCRRLSEKRASRETDGHGGVE